jgi:putative acetyltransferase
VQLAACTGDCGVTVAADISGLGNPGETKILLDDLSGPEIAGFLQEHIEEMKAVTPPGSKHALDLDGLRSPSVRFWTVVGDGRIVGCGAIKRLDDHHGEIKSMRVAPACRRLGVASTLLAHLIAEAEGMGFLRLSLETGSFEFFEGARGLYQKYGFELCGPFADYTRDPNSVFMTKVL